jgi:hypothetical protein
MNDDELLLMNGSNEYYYEKDDIYEADIHLSIGTLYIKEFDKGTFTSNSFTNAMTHLDQAVRLYEMSSDDTDHSITTNMTLAKYYLFLLHLRDGNYHFAAQRYNDAIDWLRKLDALVLTDSDMFEDNDIDPNLFAEESILQHQPTKRNPQPFKSLKQQQRKKTYESEKTTRISKMRRATNRGSNEVNVESASDTEEKPSIYIDLQHYLSQNQSALPKDLSD